MRDNLLVAKVAVDKLSHGCDILYSYNVPEALCPSAMVGQRVIIPFGKGDYRRMGLIMDLCATNCTFGLKSISMVLDAKPFVSQEMIGLIKWIKSYCFCSYFDAAKLVFPAGLGGNVNKIKYTLTSKGVKCLPLPERNEQNFYDALKSLKSHFTTKDLESYKIKNCGKLMQDFLLRGIIVHCEDDIHTVGEKLIKVYKIDDACDLQSFSFTSKQKKILSLLKESNDITLKEICYLTGVGEGVIRGLEKKGVLLSGKIKEYKEPTSQAYNQTSYNAPELSAKQKQAFDSLLESYKRSRFEVSLLHGVTGSGKTEILLSLADYVLSQNKSVIFMVPEIALTSQFERVFKNRYQDMATLIHSGLSNFERFDAWKRVNDGTAKVILGTRSAVFAPVKNLGLIVIDEEDEFTYKSESAPRFNAKDVAKFRCKYHGALLVLSSATPSVESYYKAKTGKYNLCVLEDRYGGAQLPNVEIVDMNNQSRGMILNQFSAELLEAVKLNIENGKQSLIFLNKRGYNTFAKCSHCGEVICCPHCSVSLRYHKANSRLMCHYCGYSREFSQACPKCGEGRVCYTGAGTQKAEDSLKEFIPYARILRMDSDSKDLKKSYNSELMDFAQGKYDVLVGTQMISKGFDFPNVTLVGVLSADQYLYSGDFHSYEKTFSLLTQVIGRAGRREYPGKAIIQTFTPENEILKLASRQNYEEFFENEITLRKAMLYPPFVDICIIGFVAPKECDALAVGMNFFEMLKKSAGETYKTLPLRIFAPAPATVRKVAGKYRFRIVIKCRNTKEFREMISGLLEYFESKSRSHKVHIFVDVNPDTIL